MRESCIQFTPVLGRILVEKGKLLHWRIAWLILSKLWVDLVYEKIVYNERLFANQISADRLLTSD